MHIFSLIVLFSSLFYVSSTDERFQHWDRNGDGKLIPAEVPVQLRGNFKRVDTNGDGFISLEEHQSALGIEAETRKDLSHHEVKILRDIAYAGSEHPRQRLDLFVPRQLGNAPRPLVVYIHGGGWQSGDRRSGWSKLRSLVERGTYVGASVGYRLSGDAFWPAQIHDCAAAIRWLKANAEQYGIDPNRIAVWGDSAGGHLVSMLGVASGQSELVGLLGPHPQQSSSVQAVIDFYGPTDLLEMQSQSRPGDRIDHDAADSPESKLFGKPLQSCPTEARAASPLTHVSSDDSPILIVHGDADGLVPWAQSSIFAEKLKAADVKVEMITVRGGGHGGFRNPEVFRYVEAFLDHHLRGISKVKIPESVAVGDRVKK